MSFNASLTIKLKPELLDLINKVSHDREEPKSNLVRRAILKELASFLPDIQKKALGLSIPSEVEV